MMKSSRSLKRILSLVLILCFSVLALAACGSSTPNADDASGAIGAINWSYSKDTKTLSLTGAGPMDNVTVSEDSDAPWAEARLSAEKIVVNEGITAIGTYAFWGMDNVTSVSLPSTLTEIRDFAFAFCGKLDNVSFPTGLVSIGKSAFEGCGTLGSVFLHEATISVGDYAFAYCYSMKSAILTGVPAEGSLLIGARAFENCRSLENLVLRTSVSAAHLGENAFLNASKNWETATKTDNATGATTITTRYMMNGAEVTSMTGTTVIEYGTTTTLTPTTIDGYTVSPLSVTVEGDGTNKEVVFTYTAIPVESAPAESESVPAETEDPDGKVNAGTIVAIVVMALIIVAIAVGAILLLRSDKKNTKKNGYNKNPKAKK